MTEIFFCRHTISPVANAISPAQEEVGYIFPIDPDRSCHHFVAEKLPNSSRVVFHLRAHVAKL